MSSVKGSLQLRVVVKNSKLKHLGVGRARKVHTKKRSGIRSWKKSRNREDKVD